MDYNFPKGAEKPAGLRLKKSGSGGRKKDDTADQIFPVCCPQQQLFRGSRGMPYFPVRYFTADTGVGEGTWFFSWCKNIHHV